MYFLFFLGFSGVDVKPVGENFFLIAIFYPISEIEVRLPSFKKFLQFLLCCI